ncbi:hypothetical protein BH09MYX1_BH09MYX1_10440 [soil metagenome]
MTKRALLFSAAGAFFFAACGGSVPDTTPQPTDDAGADVIDTDAEVDAGPAKYPADHTPLPQVDYHGGRVLDTMKIVTVTFANDDQTLVGRLNDFGDTITNTPWWSETTSEYCAQPKNTPCIGPGSGGGHTSIADAPAASYTDSSGGGASTIQDFIKAHVIDKTLPDPTMNTLYAIYFPKNVSINLDGSESCNSFGAYHNTVTLHNAKNELVVSAYAIMPRCGGEQTTTTSASHEFVEAATDPDVGLNLLSYYMTSSLWAVAGGEVGDLCVDFAGANDKLVELGYTVQRSWSNKSASMSHDPCVPIPAGSVYFNAAPRKDRIILKNAGDTATVDFDAFSDAPTADWTVSALDFAQFQGGQSSMSFAVDKKTVNNGTHITVTVTATKTPPPQGGFALLSKQGSNTHFWPVEVRRN